MLKFNKVKIVPVITVVLILVLASSAIWSTYLLIESKKQEQLTELQLKKNLGDYSELQSKINKSTEQEATQKKQAQTAQENYDNLETKFRNTNSQLYQEQVAQPYDCVTRFLATNTQFSVPLGKQIALKSLIFACNQAIDTSVQGLKKAGTNAQDVTTTLLNALEGELNAILTLLSASDFENHYSTYQPSLQSHIDEIKNIQSKTNEMDQYWASMLTLGK